MSKRNNSAALPAASAFEEEDTLGVAGKEQVEETKIELPFSRMVDDIINSILSKLPDVSESTVRALIYIGLDLKEMVTRMRLKSFGWTDDDLIKMIRLSETPESQWTEEETKLIKLMRGGKDTGPNPYEMLYRVRGTGPKRDLNKDLSFCGAFAAARTPVVFTTDKDNKGFRESHLKELKEIADFYGFRLTEKGQGRNPDRIPLDPYEPTFARIGILMSSQVATMRKSMGLKSQVSVPYPMTYDGASFQEDCFPKCLQFSSVATICPTKWTTLFLSIIEYLVFVDKKINKKYTPTPRDTIVSIAEASRDGSHISDSDRESLMKKLEVRDELWIPSKSEKTADFSKTKAFRSFIKNVDIEDARIPYTPIVSGLGEELVAYIFSLKLLDKKETEKSGFLVFDEKKMKETRESF